MNEPLGTLVKLNLQEAWETEAGHFTPWLAREENLALLGTTLKVDLELVGQEQNVGPFRADIVCLDTADRSTVLIENQLARTDHSHTCAPSPAYPDACILTVNRRLLPAKSGPLAPSVLRSHIGQILLQALASNTHKGLVALEIIFADGAAHICKLALSPIVIEANVANVGLEPFRLTHWGTQRMPKCLERSSVCRPGF